MDKEIYFLIADTSGLCFRIPISALQLPEAETLAMWVLSGNRT